MQMHLFKHVFVCVCLFKSVREQVKLLKFYAAI